MTERMSLESKHRHLTFYPGVKRRKQVQALMQVLKSKGTTLSEVMRPFLDGLIEQHNMEIEEFLKEREGNENIAE